MFIKGLKWRVGNGENIFLYKHRLLLGVVPIVLSPRCLPNNSKITILIHHTGSWRNLFIEEHFLRHEAKLIKEIPLANRGVMIGWHRERY